MVDVGDLYGLRNNLQRVFVTLMDGKWHGPTELQAVGGQNFGARVRELREERCGGLTVECRKNPKGSGSQYRLDPKTVSEATRDLILEGKIPPRNRTSRVCPVCRGKGSVPIQADRSKKPASVPIDTRQWNDVFDAISG